MSDILLHGAGVLIMGNGLLVGWATGISFTRSINSKYIYEIDSIQAAEIATPTTYAVIGTLTGIHPRSGGIEVAGLFNASTINHIINHPYCTLDVTDRLTGQTVYSIQNVVFDQESVNFSPRSVQTSSAQFKGMFVKTDSSQF
jgi:hypothetical protein